MGGIVGSRIQSVLWIGLMAGIALLLPLGLGQLFTAWRATMPQDPGPPPPALAPAPAATPAPERVANLRPVDGVMFSLAEGAFRMKAQPDVRPDGPYRIDFLGSVDGRPQAKVDLERDGRFDEVWTYEMPIRREVSPADDGPAEQYTWDGYDWVRIEAP
jgi:hypothetical protein